MLLFSYLDEPTPTVATASLQDVTHAHSQQLAPAASRDSRTPTNDLSGSSTDDVGDWRLGESAQSRRTDCGFFAEEESSTRQHQPDRLSFSSAFFRPPLQLWTLPSASLLPLLRAHKTAATHAMPDWLTTTATNRHQPRQLHFPNRHHHERPSPTTAGPRPSDRTTVPVTLHFRLSHTTATHGRPAITLNTTHSC